MKIAKKKVKELTAHLRYVDMEIGSTQGYWVWRGYIHGQEEVFTSAMVHTVDEQEAARGAVMMKVYRALKKKPHVLH